jgi:hypothetical protein
MIRLLRWTTEMSLPRGGELSGSGVGGRARKGDDVERLCRRGGWGVERVGRVLLSQDAMAGSGVRLTGHKCRKKEKACQDNSLYGPRREEER